MTRTTRIQAKLTTAALALALLGLQGGALAQPSPTKTPAKPAAATAKPAAPAPAKPAPGAKPNLAEAKAHYLGGEAKYKAGDYAGALADFQVADGIKATPQAARYIGLCEDKLGHYSEAVAAYDRFLADVPAKLAKEGDEIKKREEEIKAMPAKVHVETSPAGAVVTMDGRAAGGPTPTDVDVAPGHHTLHLAAAGRVAQDKEIDVTFASKQDVSAELAPAAAPEPAAAPVAVVATPAPAPTEPPPPPPEPRSKLPAYVTGGLAIVAAGVGTVFGVVALGDKSDFDKSPSTQKADDGENHALIADMAFGVAITLGVTSAVLFLTRDEAPPAAAAKSSHPKKLTLVPAPIVTPHGGGAGALLRF